MSDQSSTTGTATSRANLARKAIRKQTHARLAISGPSGAGKTWTALCIARIIAPNSRAIVIDTEPGDGAQSAATLYADHFDFDAIEWEPPFDPRDLALTIRDLGKTHPEGVLIIDSASHFWRGPGGTLDIADGRFGGWKAATPAQDQMVDAILRSSMHVICCTRAKQSYEVEQGQDGKQNVRKLGLAPIQRDDLEYEFQVVMMMDDSHRIDVGKTRAAPLAGLSFPANEQDRFAGIYAEWLAGGVSLARQLEVDAMKVAIKRVPAARMAALTGGLRDDFGPAAALTDEAMPAIWARLSAELDIAPHRFVDVDGDGFCSGCSVPVLARWHDPKLPPLEPAAVPPVDPGPPVTDDGPDPDPDPDPGGVVADNGPGTEPFDDPAGAVAPAAGDAPALPIDDLDPDPGPPAEGPPPAPEPETPTEPAEGAPPADYAPEGSEPVTGDSGASPQPSDDTPAGDFTPCWTAGCNKPLGHDEDPDGPDAAHDFTPDPADRLDDVIATVGKMSPRQINDALSERGVALSGNVQTCSARLVSAILADRSIDGAQDNVKDHLK